MSRNFPAFFLRSIPVPFRRYQSTSSTSTTSFQTSPNVTPYARANQRLNPVQLRTNPLPSTYIISEDELDSWEAPESDAESIDSLSPARTSDLTAAPPSPSAPRARTATPTTISSTNSFAISDSHLVITSGDISHRVSLSALRDSCTCSQCVDPSTRQRALTSAQAHLSARSGEPFIRQSPQGLSVAWADGHKSTHSWSGLTLLTTPGRSPSFFARTYWNTSERLLASKLYHDYPLETPKALHNVLRQVQKYGLAIVRKVPTDETSHTKCALRSFATRIGPIRDTFYGTTWDVKSMPNSKNVAYTDLDLGLHMDLLYFSEPPRFQLLHCLRNRVQGGISYFVDSFAAVTRIKTQDVDAYHLLRRNSLRFEYDNDSHYLANTWPIIPHNRQTLRAAVNWSPPFQCSKNHRADDAFYDALVTWERTLADPSARFEFKLKEGELVIFDNRRILHARTSFRDYTEEERQWEDVELVPGEPTRWLKGCYLDGDAVWDKMTSLPSL